MFSKKTSSESLTQRVKAGYKKHRETKAVKKEKESKKFMLDELFNDLYNNRKRIYKINFIRGIFFGVGSAIGGTVVVALLIWVLSVFVHVPFVGDLFEDTQNSIQQNTSDSR